MINIRRRKYDKIFLTLDTETSVVGEKAFIYLNGFYDGENKYLSRTPTTISR